ncbi:GAF and HD-GYP domain-containing protein [Pseudomarimonas arenosa]|uniref:GAF domain-containing protein n=1 Tax=Pseudomarimonas arenosa TaxID=2774145 RepID=A0AAW3ZJF2_9GAMM|nr:HD family phosphohydrolase [Pseudomarimonas arenosa]MBD8526126.1 GAF domain-containing protein [Pseudomarimonas arenosa]
MTRDSDILQRLNTLIEVGAALSSERDIRRLLETILESARRLTRADGGTLYRVEDQKKLRFEVLRNDSLGYNMGGRSGQPIDFRPIELYDRNGEPNRSTVVTYAALSGETVNVADAYNTSGFDFAGTRKFDADNGYRSTSFLTVPMKNGEGEVIGVLQLINALDPEGRVTAFSDADQQLVESLASQAAIALSNRLLIEQQERLFESLIGLINAAIDEKSPYTGGHCERVPALTMMIAEAADRITSGPLADFSMSEKDRYELKIAGLLHDCGKITTPVHVVDKGTKLETLFDRVHMLDTRFEVLIRDQQLAAARGEITEQECQARIEDLLQRREQVRSSNIGGEFMDDAKIAEIESTAKLRWTPYGSEEREFLDADERENLTIRKGTLTRRERDIINHHIVVTIKMLEALPWPKHLTKVPEYAGGHHERMDGKGYPRGLTREQMSVQARVMGIADIFEALTAGDRPYKDGKSLSEAIRILALMKQDHHIDPDLFEVFLREKVYLRYAKRFLPAHQIDSVDWSKIPGLSPELVRDLQASEGGGRRR